MLIIKNVLVFLVCLPCTLSHLHPLQVDNCESNSQFVVDEDDNVKSGFKVLTGAAPHVRKPYLDFLSYVIIYI